MKKDYKVYAAERKQVYVEVDSIIDILKQEKVNLLGGSDRYIEKGIIYEEDYRFNSPDTVREATPYEIEINDAFYKVIEHLKQFK